MKRRWYEMSADVCILVSMIELAQKSDRERYAKKLINELLDLGYEPEPNMYEQCKDKYEMNRWYDSDKDVFLAIEYLKNAQKEIQNTAISRISDYMRLQAV
jgi:hypothetical protein